MAVTMRTAPCIFSASVALAGWWLAAELLGARLVPSPLTTGKSLFVLLGEMETWKHICITVFRGLTGLTVSLVAAVLTGLPAGLNRRIMDLIGPLTAALQSCPTIIWIALLMVWVGTGSVVPVAVVTAALFPPLFANVAQGAAALDKRLTAMAGLYKVPLRAVVRDLVIPGISPFVLAGLSYAVGACWRVVAVAEFLGSSTGVGARLYWSYRLLDMPQLFAWALLLVGWGLSLEIWLVRPLRGLAAQRTS